MLDMNTYRIIVIFQLKIIELSNYYCYIIPHISLNFP